MCDTFFKVERMSFLKSAMILVCNEDGIGRLRGFCSPVGELSTAMISSAPKSSSSVGYTGFAFCSVVVWADWAFMFAKLSLLSLPCSI